MKYIELKAMPFQQYQDAPQPGIMVTNPPYGERISSRDLLGLYNMIGERMKHALTNYTVWILSYKDECFEKIGLRPSEKLKLMNGSMECEYRFYEIFEGKNKDYKKALNEEGGDRPAFDRPSAPSDRRSGSGNSSRPFNPSFKNDRPERRFAAAHSEDEEERSSFVPGKSRRVVDSPAKKPFNKSFSKPRFKDNDDSFEKKKTYGDRKPFGDKKTLKKPFKRGDREDKGGKGERESYED